MNTGSPPKTGTEKSACDVLPPCGFNSPGIYTLAIGGPAGGIPIIRTARQNHGRGRADVTHKHVPIARASCHIGERPAVWRPGSEWRIFPRDFHRRKAIIADTATGVNHPRQSACKQRDRQTGDYNLRFRPRCWPRSSLSRACRLNPACTFRKPLANLPQFAIQIASGIVAVRGVFSEQALYDPSQGWRHGGRKLCSILAYDGGHCFGSAVTPEGALSRGQLI